VKNFTYKNVYIVGGSSGIGLSSAKLFASQGACVAIFARNEKRLHCAVQEIESQRIAVAQRFCAYSLDVTDFRQVQDVFTKCTSSFGDPEILINAAGRARPGYFEKITREQLADTMNVNLFGIWNTISVALPQLKRNTGYIVNISSLAGLIGVFGYSDYCASKFAIIGLSEVLRSEFRRYGITVSVLCPPDTHTPGFHEENLTKPRETQAISAGVKLLHPDQVGRALLRGMRKRQFLIVPGIGGKLAAMAKRLVPAWVDATIDNKARRAPPSSSYHLI